MLFGIRKWITTVLISYLDRTLVSMNESIKAFIQEVWQLGIQLANILIVTFLGFFHQPGYQNYLEQRNRIKKKTKQQQQQQQQQQQNTTIKKKIDKIDQNILYQKQQKQRLKDLNYSSNYSPSLFGNNDKQPTPFVQLLNDSDSSPSISSSASLSNIKDDNYTTNQGNPSNIGSPFRKSASTSSIKVNITGNSGSSSPARRYSSSQTNDSTLTTQRSRKKKKRLYYVNRDLVHQHEQITTGFLEDLKTNILLLFDNIFYWLRIKISSILTVIANIQIRSLVIFFITLPLYLPFYIVKIFTLPFTMILPFFKFIINRLKKVKNIPNRLFSDKELDVRSVKEIIEQAGYPYERYHVTTEDGYILLLERIPNKQSKHTLYLQHGIFDNSFAWVANGPTQSLAFAAHDQGYDVFLANLRGNGERLHTENNISSRQYWDFSINEHAFRDIPSFIQVIRQVKIKELSSLNNDIVSYDDINISAVAHSMGAACILMYIVMMGILKKSHHLSRAIVLSPAGYHERAPKIVDILGPIINAWLYFFPMHVFRFPSDSIRVVTAKIYHDVISNTPTKDLMVYLASRFLLGGDIKNHPLEKIHNLAYNTFSGTSVKIYRHFWQIRKSRKFQAYDYGKEKNLQEYGTPQPLNFLDHYNLINIPIHFIMGLKDNLIEPVNIIKHYTTLKKHHPQYAFLKASKSGHIEFTLGLDDQIMNYIMNILNPNNSQSHNPASISSFSIPTIQTTTNYSNK